MNAVRVGIRTFREEYITPEEIFGWDTYEARVSRYAVYEAMRDNTVYRDIQKWASAFKLRYSLYKHIQGIYNPVGRAVEIIAAKTMGGMIDWENLKTGAIPITGADEPLIEALLQVMRWSKMGQTKTLFARQAATLGDCGLWIVDEPEREKVRIEVLHPAKIKDARFDSVGNVIKATIEYTREWVDPQGKAHDVLYRMEVEKDGEFVTYKDDEEYGWHTDAQGNGISRWPNPYGFVPLVIANFKDLGLRYGANCFYATINKINEVNHIASILGRGISKAADPPFAASGVLVASDIVVPGQLDDGTSTTEPSSVSDETPIIGLPKDSSITSLAPTIDIAGIAKYVLDILQEIENDIPELAMQRVREAGDVSGIAIRNMYTDAVGRLTEAMGNLDDALIRALQMAVSIGGFRGYDEFGPYDLNSYDRGDLDFYIKERQLFEDGFTPEQRVAIIQALPSNPAAARHILVNELEISEEDADAIIAGQVSTPAQNPGDIVDGQIVPPNQLNGQPPQLTAGQQAGDNGSGAGGDISAEVQRILSEVGVAA